MRLLARSCGSAGRRDSPVVPGSGMDLDQGTRLRLPALLGTWRCSPSGACGSRIIQPLAVYPWWHRGLKSRKLAGELAFWDDGYSDGFKRITTFR